MDLKDSLGLWKVEATASLDTKLESFFQSPCDLYLMHVHADAVTAGRTICYIYFAFASVEPDSGRRAA